MDINDPEIKALSKRVEAAQDASPRCPYLGAMNAGIRFLAKLKCDIL